MIFQLLKYAGLLCALMCTAEDMEERLELPIYGQEQLWRVQNSEVWEDADTHTPVSIACQNGMLSLNWRGRAFAEEGLAPSGLVISREALPVVAGPDHRIRLMVDALVDRLAPDAEFVPVVLLQDENGREISRFDIYPPDYLMYVNQRTAPDRPRRYDRSFVVPENARTMKLGLAFRGNAAAVRITRASLSPASPKMKWNLEERWEKRPHKPDIPYGVQDAEPELDVPVWTEEQVRKYLESLNYAVAELKTVGDRVRFTIDGREEPFVLGWQSGDRAGAQFQRMRKSGIRLFAIYVSMGPRADFRGWPSKVWLDENQYAFEKIGDEIRRVLTVVPDACFFLYVRMTLPTAWAEKNPEAIFTNAAGERAYSEWSRINGYLKDGETLKTEREFYEADNVSETFREGGSRALFALGRYLNTAVEGKVVLGAYIHGGADTQWFHSDEGNYGNYGLPARKAFRKFLQQKYHFDNAALAAAWEKRVTFDSAEMPDYADRQKQFGPDENAPRSPLMSYNGHDRQRADYNEFLSKANVQRQIAFSRALKAGADNRLLAGTYWPTIPCAYPLMHNDFIEMLNAPEVDFISRGGLPGCVLHGKMTVAELDLRNARSGLDAWLDHDHPFHAKSQAEFRRQVLLSFCSSWASGGGFHLWEMMGGWHYHPTTQRIFTEVLKMSSAIKDFDAIGEDYIGVFLDDEAANACASLGWPFNSAAVENFFYKFGWNYSSAWEKVGLPVRFFLLQDALNPALKVPRVAVFPNALTMTLEQGEAIRRRFECGHRAVVYMTEPGLAAPGTPENPAKITGFKLRPDVPGTSGKVLRKCAEDPIFAGMDAQTCIGLHNFWANAEWNNCAASEPDSPGKLLATYEGTTLGGMLVDRNEDRTKLWIGCPGALNIPMLRNLAREAGLQPMVENDAGIFYGAGILGVVASPAGGPQKVRIPRNAQVLSCLTGHSYVLEGEWLKFTAAAAENFGDVAVFSVDARKE